MSHKFSKVTTVTLKKKLNILYIYIYIMLYYDIILLFQTLFRGV